ARGALRVALSARVMKAWGQPEPPDSIDGGADTGGFMGTFAQPYTPTPHHEHPEHRRLVLELRSARLVAAGSRRTRALGGYPRANPARARRGGLPRRRAARHRPPGRREPARAVRLL